MKIKINILLLLSMLVFASCSDQREKIPCGKFKTGKFFIKPKNGIPGFSLSRNDSVQYETDNRTGGVVTYKVTWTGECAYQLLLLQESGNTIPRFKNNKQAFFDSLRKTPLTIRIVSTANDYCIFEAKREGISMVYGDTLWIEK